MQRKRRSSNWNDPHCNETRRQSHNYHSLRVSVDMRVKFWWQPDSVEPPANMFVAFKFQPSQNRTFSSYTPPIEHCNYFCHLLHVGLKGTVYMSENGGFMFCSRLIASSNSAVGDLQWRICSLEEHDKTREFVGSMDANSLLIDTKEMKKTKERCLTSLEHAQ